MYDEHDDALRGQVQHEGRVPGMAMDTPSRPAMQQHSPRGGGSGLRENLKYSVPENLENPQYRTIGHLFVHRSPTTVDLMTYRSIFH